MRKLLSLLAICSMPAWAVCAMGTATINGTLLKADNSAYTGSFTVSWSTFDKVGGGTIQGGKMSVSLSSGAFSACLWPTTSTYRIDFDNMKNATLSSEHWLVPSATTYTQAQVRTFTPTQPVSTITSLPNLVTVGTLTAGVWNATAIAAQYGGTGDNTSATTGVPKITAGNWTYDATAQDLTDWPSGVSNTEVGYLDGVTSAIQTQLDGKASTGSLAAYLPLAGGTTTGQITMIPASGAYAADLQKSGSAGTLRVYDQTAVTGVSQQVIRAGAGQSTNGLLVFRNNADTTLSVIGPQGDWATYNPSDGKLKTNFAYYGTYLASDVGLGWNATNDLNSFSIDTLIGRNAAGVVEVNNGTPGTYRDIIVRSTIGTATTAADASLANSQFMLILTSNTNLQVRAKGSDGTVRSANITLAP